VALFYHKTQGLASGIYKKDEIQLLFLGKTA
jgi:hypothetical protein